MNTDGDRQVFYPTGHGLWMNAINGELSINEYGNTLVIRTPESKLIAYPTGHNSWLCNGSLSPIEPEPKPPDPPNPPNAGHFSWPFDPTPGHYVTSEFGPRNGRFHEGTDFSGGPASYGQPIKASNAGIVHQSGLNGNFGWSVILRHPNYLDGWVLYTLYAHMPEAAPRPPVGSNVTKGQVIGQVNNTGSSFGSHLHFETHQHPNGGRMIWDNLNPSYNSPRTAVNSRHFMTSYGDGAILIP